MAKRNLAGIVCFALLAFFVFLHLPEKRESGQEGPAVFGSSVSPGEFVARPSEFGAAGSIDPSVPQAGRHIIEDFHGLGRVMVIPAGDSEEAEVRYCSAERLIVDAGTIGAVGIVLEHLREAGLEARQPYSFSPLVYVELYAAEPEDLDLVRALAQEAVGTMGRVAFDWVSELAPASLPVFEPNDTRFRTSWHHEKIQTPAAWAITQGDASVLVAVLDTGLSNWSGEFDGRIEQGYNFADDNEDTLDIDGHGTAVTSVLAATGNNGKLVTGIDWKCRILPVKILDEDNFEISSKVIAAVDYSLSKGARVINISSGSRGSFSQELFAAFYRAHKAGALIVNSAGNRGFDSVNGFGLEPSVISVGGSNKSDELSVSSWGLELDLLAPNVGITGLKLGISLDWLSGTSVSAPMVSGTASLIMAIRPDLSPDEVAALIYAGADDLYEPGWDEHSGWGRLNVGNSLVLARAATRIEPVEDGVSISVQSPSIADGKVHYRLDRSEDLSAWAGEENVIFQQALEDENRQSLSILPAEPAEFYRVGLEFQEDYSPRAIPRFEDSGPATPAIVFARSREPFVPDEEALAAYQGAQEEAIEAGEVTVSGYYRCWFDPKIFSYLIRYERSGRRWPITSEGWRLQQVAGALTMWGVADRLDGVRGEVLLRVDRDQITPPIPEYRRQLEKEYGEDYYLFINTCLGDIQRGFYPGKKVIEYYPSAGELISIDEATLSFVSKLPDDLLAWLEACDLISKIEPLEVASTMSE